MKKTTYILLVLAALLAVFASACGGAEPAPQAVPPTDAAPAAPVEAPTQQVVPAVVPTTQTFAPACQNAASSCVAPEVPPIDAANTYCVKKIPYTNIPVPDGTTFEVLDKSGDYICADSGTFDNDGKRIITCHGRELYKFDLKLTNPACGVSNLQTGTGQCQDGFGFDAAQGCCAPLTSGGDAGSVVVTVNLGACPEPRNP
jgi:hypothetical protein